MFKASFKLHRISDVGFIDDAAEDLPIKCQELEGFQSNSTLILSDDRYIYRKNRTPKEGEALHVICANSSITRKMRKTSPDVLQECKGKIDRHCYLLSFHTDFTNRIYLSLSATGTIDNNGIIKLRSKHTHTPGTQSFFVPLSFKGHQDLKMSFFVLYRTKCVPFPVEMPCLVGLLCKCGQKIDVSPGCSKILLIWDCVPPPRRSSSRGSAQKKTSRASPASLKSAETRKRLRQGEAVREKGDT